MGKAYSEDEKEKIRVKLMEEGVKLFHENGSKTLSIRELTKRAGIAQGGFYSFYEDKDALIRDIVSYRGKQKVRMMEEKLPESLAAPMVFLEKGCCWYVLDLIRKVNTSKIYADTVDLLLRDMEKEKGSFHMDLLNEVFAYWQANGFDVKVDSAGLANLFTGVFVLGRYGNMLDEKYLEEEAAMLLKAGLEKYVEVSRK